jgi:hypothetical protein
VSIFLGRAPAETHTTTHPDGSVSVTVVTREPLWTDGDREAAYALYDDEDDKCPQHGGPMSECEDPPDVYPVRKVCWIAAAQTVAERERAKETEDALPDEAGYLPTDGESIVLSFVDPNPDEAVNDGDQA